MEQLATRQARSSSSSRIVSTQRRAKRLAMFRIGNRQHRSRR